MMYSNDNKNEFLTKDQIREIAPSVFTQKADKRTTSKHYVHIPTEKVIDDMPNDRDWETAGAISRI